MNIKEIENALDGLAEKGFFAYYEGPHATTVVLNAEVMLPNGFDPHGYWKTLTELHQKNPNGYRLKYGPLKTKKDINHWFENIL